MTMARLWKTYFGGKVGKTKIQNRGDQFLSKIGFWPVGIGFGQVQGHEPEPYEAKIDRNSIKDEPKRNDQRKCVCFFAKKKT